MAKPSPNPHRLTCQDAEDDFLKELQWIAGDVYRLIYQAEELSKVVKATWLPNKEAGYSWAGCRAQEAVEILEKLSQERELLRRIAALKKAVFDMVPSDRWAGMDTEDPRVDRERPI